MIKQKGGSMKSTRGQAAMEFLMTYGWAILAAIVAIGALVYFGVFDPSRFVGTSAALSSPFFVQTYKVNTTGVLLEVRNDASDSVTISKVALTKTPAAATCTDYTNSTAISIGDSQSIIVSCSGLSEGDSFKGDIQVVYTKSGSTTPLESTGTIKGKVGSI